jgi:hypothetical protein
MSSRERWVIYPLLFFAFCLAARDQFPYLQPEVVEIPRLSCKVIDTEFLDTKKMAATNLRADYIEAGKRIDGDVVQFNVVDTGELVCNRMVLQTTAGRRVAEFGNTDGDAGQLVICNADESESIVIAAREESGQIESRHKTGLRMLIHATKNGGEAYVVDTENNVVAQFDVPRTRAGRDEPSPDTSKTTTSSATGDDNE